MNFESHVEKLRARLVKHRGNYLQICQIGELDYSWLNKFARGVYPNPRIQNLDALLKALDDFEASKSERPAA